jgi:hypothetical protein
MTKLDTTSNHKIWGEDHIDLIFGQVTYEPGAPKDAPRWLWMCDCAECKKLDRDKREIHAPFKSKLAAERDAYKWLRAIKGEPPPCEIRADRDGVFVIFDGTKIARRADPDTPQAKTWVALEPGYQVLDNADLTAIAVYYHGKQVH